MTSILVSPTQIPAPADVTLLADNPADMLAAQKELILWCEQKVACCNAEMIEAEGNAARAAASGWPGEQRRWKRVRGRRRAQVIFYDKIKKALEAGYYIVPPFPGQVFAIRKRENAKPSSYRTYHSRAGSTDHEQGEDILPAGEGVYRNPLPAIQNATARSKDDQGKEVVLRESWATNFLPMEFPIKLVRPEILSAASRAMVAKVFDRLSVLPRFASADPIIMGEIRDPTRPYAHVNFFVAWWLDTRSL